MSILEIIGIGMVSVLFGVVLVSVAVLLLPGILTILAIDYFNLNHWEAIPVCTVGFVVQYFWWLTVTDLMDNA